MNQAATSYTSRSPVEGAASASSMLRELVAAMPIVVLFKAIRAAFATR